MCFSHDTDEGYFCILEHLKDYLYIWHHLIVNIFVYWLLRGLQIKSRQSSLCLGLKCFNWFSRNTFASIMWMSDRFITQSSSIYAHFSFFETNYPPWILRIISVNQTTHYLEKANKGDSFEKSLWVSKMSQLWRIVLRQPWKKCIVFVKWSISTFDYMDSMSVYLL